MHKLGKQFEELDNLFLGLKEDAEDTIKKREGNCESSDGRPRPMGNGGSE